ncbi:NAD(P)-binding protein [Butyriboletus roseoflavus]|nr:NAD(P)-binding protein [Butyriboletus roseoflavus]
MTEHLLAIGNKVVATLRKPEVLSDLTARYPPTQLLVVKVDVTNNADITAAFAKAEEVFGRIDVVFNNAGVIVSGEVESVDDADARGMFDVNFWGAACVTKEAVRILPRTPGGRSSSSATFIQLSLALEGLTECLASELDPAWNIKVIPALSFIHLGHVLILVRLFDPKVTILEPGPYRTGILQGNYPIAPQHPAYANPALRTSQIRKFLSSTELFDGDVTKAAVVIEKFSRLEDAPIRFPLHRKGCDGYEGQIQGAVRGGRKV